MTEAAKHNMPTDYPIGVFTSVFNGQERFLADHIIQGRKILPGMGYLEISRAAVERSVNPSDDYMIVLKDSLFMTALLVDDVEREVTVSVYPGANGEFGVEVSTDQGVHFQTKVLIKKKETPAPVDIDTIRADCQVLGPDRDSFYATFRSRDVYLGPSHLGVQEIHLGEQQGFVRVAISGSSKRGMVMDPGMLDSIIQGGVAMSDDPEAEVVPFAVVQTEIFRPLTDEMYVWMQKTAQGLDYTVFDEKGELIVIITGFLTAEIDLNKGDQLVFYKPEWKEQQDTDTKDLPRHTIEADGDFNRLVHTVFNKARSLITDKAEESVLQVRIPEANSHLKGIVGALKTVSQEYSKLHYEVIAGGQRVDLGYTFTEMSTAPMHQWEDGAHILITGGLGGIGRIIVDDISRNSTGGKLILVGSSELNDERQAYIDEVKARGTDVVYARTDITDKAQVEALIKEYPSITGIIHGSGTLKDAMITSKDEAEINAVMAPKVQGLEYLDHASADLPLSFFVALSSVAGTLGNSGQIDYAAANAFMDAYMHERASKVAATQRSGRSISINWPLWDSAGMQIDEETKDNLLRTFKIKPLPAEEGMVALKQVIASEHTQLAVVFGVKKSIAPMFEPKKAAPKKAKPKAASGDADKLARAILQEVRKQTIAHLKLKNKNIEDTADWAEFGFDSILMSSFVNRFNSAFGLNLMPTVMFEATNMLAFSEFLAENHAEEMEKQLAASEKAKSSNKAVEESKVELTLEEPELEEPDDSGISAFAQTYKKSFKSVVNYREEDVAIIGMSCSIAGARNAEEFWDVLNEGKCMVSTIPEDRWDWRDYPGVANFGTFIEDVDKFDALFFGISPAEAMYMNPEQRLMMQYVWHCLEDAGYGGDELKGTNTGLFMGCGPSGYAQVLEGLPILAYSATGTVASVGPNRISYLMDWHGPSHPIDTACSSALVALHRGVECIRKGQCDQVVAGGINLLLSVNGFISFSKSGMLAADGRCKTFSNKADGYVRGEGVGVLLIKSLKAALADGDKIHAVVKGTAENHGGRTTSLTAPNPKAQAAVIKAAVKDAGIDFSRVSYIECHGTGTELGDPVEIRGLRTVVKDLMGDEEITHTCKLGSIKSNIGHLEYGAGAVGLVKVILQIKHRRIAQSLFCEELNPYIDLKGTPFQIAQQASDWVIPEGQTRIAGVSSFGFGGVNSHIILEEYREPEDNALMDDSPQLFVLSARSEDVLFEYAKQYRDFIKQVDASPDMLRNIAYTMQVGRAEQAERLVFVASTLEEWAEQLDVYIEDKGKTLGSNVFRGSVYANAADNIELGDTDAGVEYIKQLVAANEAEKLAELWVKGTKVDWFSLHKTPEIEAK